MADTVCRSLFTSSKTDPLSGFEPYIIITSFFCKKVEIFNQFI
ncbi:hypothetical protein CLOSTMETH_02077 [[Clostridium] methylpentosum DSM 5476]|uniref:Uncharacterized protein n=1 Tax=[Clostridium] methylpentosum DSM 5476 TaxID=537013 RepID=C0EDZ8_9FIRM|nr:hypothetical protein CLOSTMETH_02077 [[Clostridium] methylpentosum DSM 5476]